MKRYSYLQLKRAFKAFPFVLLGFLATLICVVFVASTLVDNDRENENKQRLRIALTGDTDNDYIRLGIAALKTFDDARFSVELLELEQPEAQQQLKSGQLSAYVVLPENFIERALYGDVDTLTYVTHSGSQDLIIMFKNEITTIVTNIVIHSEKGPYAVADALKASGAAADVGKHMEALSIEYANLAFSRANILKTEELGISEGVSLVEYYLPALAVFLLTLIGVAFVTVYVKHDHSFEQLLASKGFGCATQVFCETVTLFVVLTTLTGTLLAIGWGALQVLRLPLPVESLPPSIFLRLIAFLAMTAAFNRMMFELSSNVVNVVLLHFIACIGQCYACGCFYPLYTLPVPLQHLARFLPCGIAREFLEGSFTYEARLLQLVGLFTFTMFFFAVSVFLRRRKVISHRR